jgi:hypothetical protein
MRRAHGYLCISDPIAGTREADTFTCAHCQRIVICRVRDPAALGGYCRHCDRLVCAKCAGGDCVPFLKRIEALEERDYRRRQFARMAGL